MMPENNQLNKHKHRKTKKKTGKTIYLVTAIKCNDLLSYIRLNRHLHACCNQMS